jgi:hypothetical protein
MHCHGEQGQSKKIAICPGGLPSTWPMFAPSAASDNGLVALHDDSLPCWVYMSPEVATDMNTNW